MLSMRFWVEYLVKWRTYLTSAAARVGTYWWKWCVVVIV